MNPAPVFSRRSFLRASVAAGATVALGAWRVPQVGAEVRESNIPDWVDRPMRWAQLTLVEDDPGKFDPQFWLDYFKRTRSDAVTLSAGGCVAYYPTQIPFHHRSQWLGESDPFVSASQLQEFDVREIAGARHLVNVERPDEFNEILAEFLGRV